MTIEQIELRKILTQMLADQDINQITLRKMVEEILEEKIDKIIREKIDQTHGKFSWIDTINSRINEYIKSAIREIVRPIVMNAIDPMSINVTLKKKDED
jgi:ferritin-like metal-binding protein YciE